VTGSGLISGSLVVQDGVAPGGIVTASGGSTTRGFGGHVASLALTAAYQTVPQEMCVQHVHVEFLRPAVAGPSVEVPVTVIRDGRTTAHRLVEIRQADGRAVASVLAVFHRADAAGLEYQVPVTPGPGPEGSTEVRTSPMEIRLDEDVRDPSRQRVWIRSAERPLPTDPRLHDSVLLFMSDVSVLWPALRVHGFDVMEHRHSALSSMTHTMWFHRHVQADRWLLYDQQTPSTAGGLCHSEGRIFTADGLLAASVTQVGLLQPTQDPGTRTG